MCSPALLNVSGGLHEPADVLRFPLLMRRWDDWEQWLTACHVKIPKRSAGIGFSDMIQVQTAAIAGQGIMLGDETTCAGALAERPTRLAFSTTINPQRGYYLVRHRHKRASPATLGVHRRWLTLLIGRGPGGNEAARPTASELRSLGISEYRQIFFKPYRLIYRVHTKQVVVYVVADGRRDMESLLARRLLGA